MVDGRNGQVVTFYSFRGGTGRTMALANIAWILAGAGHRVLVADWDLESPGLHRYFHPFIDPNVFDSRGGVINLIREYEDQESRADPLRPPDSSAELARVDRHAFPINATFPNGGELHFLSAGRQNQDYRTSVGGLDWDAFFEHRDGAAFFEALRANMRRDYDYTLIDSRTGRSDFTDICTIHLPDTLVDCFTLSEQGLDGAAQVAWRVRTTYRTRNIRVLPVPMRVDQAEKEKSVAGRALARQRFGPLPEDLTEDQRSRYWADVEVPYRAFYAFEEILATFGDRPGTPGTLLAAYERITSFITGGTVTRMAPMDESGRAVGLSKFERRQIAIEDEIALRYAPPDQLWAEWIEQVLRHAGVRVYDTVRRPDVPVPATARVMTLLSQVNERDESLWHPHDEYGSRPPLAVYVDDLRSLPGYSPATSAHVSGRSAVDTAGGILRLVGRPGDGLVREVLRHAGRFPGRPPAIFNAPARNPRFTGRENDLRELRARLTNTGSMAVLPAAFPIALQGMGGIGKTQLAIEYAYRFQAAYDVVWWITADPPQFIDVALGELADRLGRPGGPPVSENTRATLNTLDRGEPYGRWLIVFDNADEIETVIEFLPKGHGHILVTSRNLRWRDTVDTMPIEVFTRRESVTHLRRHVGALSLDEANQVAEALGDLPIAVAAAGAWLADTGAPVGEYLQQILSDPASGYESVRKTWDLPLDRLRSRSAGAYRLLQFCSVLAPEIALELIYSEGMADALHAVDPNASDRMERGKLVQHINRLALLRLDPWTGVHVHRLLQHVVRDRMAPGELAEARHAMHVLLAAARPRGDVDSPDTWPGFRMIWPHLEVLDAANCLDETVRELLVDRVRYLWLHGAYADGERFARRIDEAWTGLLPTLDDRPDDRRALRLQLLDLRFNLANLLRERGRFDQSFALDAAVLDEQRALLGGTSPYTLMTAGSLAADLRALGRYEEALALDRGTHAIWALDFGEEYPRTLSAEHHLATSLRLAGDFRAAIRHDEDALRRRRIILGPADPATLQSGSAFGRDLREAGEYERSVEVLREVLAGHVAALGPDARGTLTAQANLAVSLRYAGRPEEAGDLLETAYERLLDGLGAGHPDTLACRLSRATNVLAGGDVELAKREMEGVEQAYRERLGDRHPHTIACVNNLAAVQRAAGSPAEAAVLAQSAMASFADVLPDGHPYILAARMNLGVCKAELRLPAEALDLLENAYRRLIEIAGPEHPDTLRCLANLVLVRGDSGDEEDVRRRLTGRLGPRHPAAIAFAEHRHLHRLLDPHPF